MKGPPMRDNAITEKALYHLPLQYMYGMEIEHNFDDGCVCVSE